MEAYVHKTSEVRERRVVEAKNALDYLSVQVQEDINPCDGEFELDSASSPTKMKTHGLTGLHILKTPFMIQDTLLLVTCT